MALSHGMNVEAVRGIAGKLEAQAGAIHNVISQVDSAVNQSQTDWKGSDATQFAGWWRDQHRPHLTKLEESLRGLAKSARINAQQQEDVSRG